MSRRHKRQTKEVREHLARVAEMSCVVSGSDFVALHHCKGGSMHDVVARPGMAQKPSDWLVIPIHPIYHNGALGIHGIYSVDEWETIYGTQTSHLAKVSEVVGFDVVERSKQ